VDGLTPTGRGTSHKGGLSPTKGHENATTGMGVKDGMPVKQTRTRKSAGSLRKSK
jgi:hypothetical protein